LEISIMRRQPIPTRSLASSRDLRAAFRPAVAAIPRVLAIASLVVIAVPSIASAQEAKLPPAPEVAPVLEAVPARTPRFVEDARNAERARNDTGESLPASAVRRLSNAVERTHVEYDEPGDGSVWARGSDYKVGFDAHGVAYAPFLGSKAPRDFPVTFRTEHVSIGGSEIAFDASASPTRAGDRVRFERGAFAEVYDLTPSSIEQSFVFETLAQRGEIVVRMGAQTELTGRSTQDGLEFSNERGAVRYGRATAIDADGARTDATTTLTDAGIEIRVPADFVAHAQLPLTIDPVVSTFNLDTSLIDSYDPDIAYDSTADRWMVVYEEIFSLTDHDVHYLMLNSTGSVVSSGYVEVSITLDWRMPKVANNGFYNRFLVVAQVQSFQFHDIEGRVYQADTGLPLPGGSFGISGSGVPYEMLDPDVGGSYLSDFCVVWERVYSNTDRDILYRLVNPDGFGEGTGFSALDNSGSTLDAVPSISKTNNGGKWNVAYERVWVQNNTLLEADIRGGRINFDGTLTGPAFPVDGSPVHTRHPSASSCLNGTDQWAIAYERDLGTDWDIGVIYMNGENATENANLTGFESITGASSNVFEDQLQPVIDSDGTSFAIVYSESVPGSSTDWNVFVSTMSLAGSHIELSEGHKILAGSFKPDDNPSIASTGGAGGPLRRYLAVWNQFVDPQNYDGNVAGGLYDGGLFTSFCHPSWDAALCPCNNPASGFGFGCNNSQNTGGARLTLSSVSSLSADTLFMVGDRLKGNALSVFNQGNSILASSLPFGQGQRCVGGSIKRLYTKTALSGGTVSAPQSGDASVHARSSALGDLITAGTTRSYYIYYRDPIVLGGCPSTSTFNTTQAVQAIWIP
jgi:hypothetical protein